jgi:hypothetical protein
VTGAAPAPAEPDWSRFPVFSWPNGPAAPSEIAAGLGGVVAGRLDAVETLESAGLRWLVFNAPGRDDLHLDREGRSEAAKRRAERWKRWYDTRDDALLVRDPCWNEPDVRERMVRLLDESLAARGGRHGFGVSLGDEVGLTPGGAPEDVCVCASCEAEWRRWSAAHGRPGLADGDGAPPPLSRVSTDATLRALHDGSTEPIGPWLARREFHQDSLLEVLATLASRVRERSPGTPVGLLGISGQSAFAGVAVERVLPLLDFVECYRVGDARELAFTLREPRQRVLLTVFCDPSGPDRTAWQAWEHWMHGGDGLVAWSEEDLARKPEHRARLERAVSDIRRVQERAGRFRPEPRGLAIVHSHAALAASWLKDALLDGSTWPRRFQSWQEEHGALETLRGKWLALAARCGVMPGALPLDRVGAGAGARFRVLVLPRQLVLDGRDLEKLREYSAAGGTIVADADLGWIDSNGTRRERAPELATVAAPAALDGDPGDPASLSDFGRWLDGRGVERAPWRIRDASTHWISTWAASEDGWLCAALPDPGAGAAWPASIAIEAAEGLRIEWIHPAPSDGEIVHLPLGDAAIFRLVPNR